MTNSLARVPCTVVTGFLGPEKPRCCVTRWKTSRASAWP